MAGKKPEKKPTRRKAGSPSLSKNLPVCNAILACTNVIVGQDKTVSVINMVDTLNVSPVKELPLGEPLDFTPLQFFASVKAGEANGTFHLFLNCIDPRGRSELVGATEAVLTNGPESGTYIISPLRFFWGGPGIYWLELRADDVSLAKIPFRITITAPPG